MSSWWREEENRKGTGEKKRRNWEKAKRSRIRKSSYLMIARGREVRTWEDRERKNKALTRGWIKVMRGRRKEKIVRIENKWRKEQKSWRRN